MKALCLLCFCQLLCFPCVFVTGFESLSIVKSYSDSSVQKQAVLDLIRRTIGDRSNEFRVEVNPQLLKNGKDVFKVFKGERCGFVEIEGSSGVAAAWGFNHYLKYLCQCQVSWQDSQVALPKNLPPVDIHITANDRFRYYQNVCTASYSFVWWDWTHWERHLDWMALNGINLALAFNGQETIWQRVYLRLNLTQAEIDEHFTGPPFNAWSRMGNIRGWGGPLSQAWLSTSLGLQKKILARMRNLGIVPVLPAFAGHVPRAFKRLFPAANMTLTSKWNSFEDRYCCPYLLSPQDPLFTRVGSMFLEEMKKEFGTNHVYNCDTFNEMPPSSGDVDYLKQVGESVYQSMTKVDPDAVWVMQGWLFTSEAEFWTKTRAEALLTSVPIGRMLVLDLMSEISPQYDRLDSYFGQPYIWCMLHNFGGTLGMHGTAKRVNENVLKARNAEDSSMVGTGLTMEGINQNYVMYDLMMENGWRKEPTDLMDWFSNFSIRRYGMDSIHLDGTWQLLLRSVYDYNLTTHNHGQYILVKHPTLRLKSNVWYDVDDVMLAWDQILMAVDMEPLLVQVSTFRYDLVDVTRQALQLKADFLYQQVIKAYGRKDASSLRSVTSSFVELLGDINSILATNKWFLLGNWLESAKRRASSPQEKDLYEEMSRNQITLWGPRGEISDYACKQWAHLMNDYYIPRWVYFFKELIAAVETKTPFNQRKVSTAIFKDVELPFTKSKNPYPIFEIGDSVEISRCVHKKWRNVEDKYEKTVTVKPKTRPRGSYHIYT